MSDFRLRIPNTTQVPNVILDHYMAELSGAELKVLLYVVRRTFGFQKEADSISLSQLVSGITTRDGRVLDKGTGLSRRAVIAALKELEDRGLVKADRVQNDTSGNQTNVYTLLVHSET